MIQLENKTILVTGASGFIGAHLVARLSTIPSVKLLLLSRLDQPAQEGNVIWLKGELMQLSAEYWESCCIDQIDFVFHLGAFIPKSALEANRIDGAVDDNILGTRALLRSLPRRPERLIFASTIDVYAPTRTDDLLTECSVVSPSTLYGASKLFCESLVSAWADGGGYDCTILRYGHIYGPGEERYEKLIPAVIRRLLAGQNPVLHGDGSALRDYLYVGDAVEATIRAALVKDNPGCTNIVRGESVTLKEVVELLIRIVGRNSTIELLSNKGNGSSFKFDNSRMTHALGHWEMTSLENGLAAEVNAVRDGK